MKTILAILMLTSFNAYAANTIDAPLRAALLTETLEKAVQAGRATDKSKNSSWNILTSVLRCHSNDRDAEKFCLFANENVGVLEDLTKQHTSHDMVMIFTDIMNNSTVSGTASQQLDGGGWRHVQYLKITCIRPEGGSSDPRAETICELEKFYDENN